MSPPNEAVRQIVVARRQAAHVAVNAMLASITLERTAGEWLDLGAEAHRAATRIKRRTATTGSRNAAR